MEVIVFLLLFPLSCDINLDLAVSFSTITTSDRKDLQDTWSAEGKEERVSGAGDANASDQR